LPFVPVEQAVRRLCVAGAQLFISDTPLHTAARLTRGLPHYPIIWVRQSESPGKSRKNREKIPKTYNANARQCFGGVLRE
jgi:hypothetical protein